MLEKRVQICTRCVMDNKSDKSITFDNNGYCNYCTDTLKRKDTEYFPNAKGKKQLDAIMSKIKEDCKNDPYDCLVGVSGGIDSSYILYLGYQYGLRMLALHVDDGFDNQIATENIRKLCEKTSATLTVIRPDPEQYADVVKCFLKASISNLAMPQDNLIIAMVQRYAKEKQIRYSLSGGNFAHECILERGDGVNASDGKYIINLHKQFGEIPIPDLQFTTLFNRYIGYRYGCSVKKVCPLNYINYNFEEAIQTLEDFCGFTYYGGKHYESILTRFLQCYYLPEKFEFDKRKSHYSSLIISDQLTREEALDKLKQPLYNSAAMLEKDKERIANILNISMGELENYLTQPPQKDSAYLGSWLNKIAPIARKLRRFLG